MANYTQDTNFAAKDSLPSGVDAKKVKGTEIYNEFGFVATAIATKVDKTGATITGNLDFDDEVRVRLGDDSDLQIYHSGSNSYIEDTGTGGLFITGNTSLTLAGGITGQTKYIVSTTGGSTDVYYANSKKLATTNTGIDVTGTVVSDGLTVDGASTTKTLVVDNSANGVVQEFKIGGAVCGEVIATAGQFASIAIGSGDTGIIFQRSSTADSIRPWDITGNQNRSGAIDLGASGAFWDDIYATNGTINTSDATEKQSIEELTEAETRVAQACKGLIRKFKWNSAVEKKGSEARYHFGVIAQDLQAAFAVEGLDAGDYGLFVSSTWTDDNGVEQTKLGVRYTELLAFIIGGTF
jgi:hypothetical protein